MVGCSGEFGDYGRVDYDPRMHAVYQVGRALPEHALANCIRMFAPDTRPLTVLDLGSGTGRFSVALPEEFGGPVHVVEPSAKMRAVATARHAHPGFARLDAAVAANPGQVEVHEGAALHVVRRRNAH